MISIKEFSLVALAVAALGMASNAGAATVTILKTSPVWADSTQSYHACNLANVSAATLASVQVDLVASDGSVITTQTTPVTAGTTMETSLFGGYSGFAWCRFTISGAKMQNSVRANITVFHYTGTYYDSLAIQSAQ